MSFPSDYMRSAATTAQSVNVLVGRVRRWMVVEGSLALIWATYGLLASNGVFLSYWSVIQLAGLPHSTTAWINGVHLFLNWSLTFPIGIVFDKRGSNILLFVGSAFYLAGIFGMAESSRFWQFLVTYGILGGAGSAILSTVAINVLGHWFDKRKGLATGIVILGGSLGGVVFPLALRPMFDEIGWSWSIRALGFFITILVGLGLSTVRSQTPAINAQSVAIRAVLRPTFLLATLGIGAFDFVLFGALGLLPEFGESLNLTKATGYLLVAIVNACSAVGRITAGMLADVIGPFNAIIYVMLVGLISMLALWLQSSYNVVLLYLFAVLFGLSSGGALSLEPLCIGELCHASHFGQYYGTCFLFVAAITLICVPAGSTILQSLGQLGFVLTFSGVMSIALAAFVAARWFLLDLNWRWGTIV
ncbi:hypothetical protein KC318_g2840 [Hortaea werneckii]|nr:hypothetical protein KC334_g4232 [Hortaea werneckii]KAI7672493.1 hypothetical protein KC318_g2840 [Hortaea werneckii]